jgi:hypothetical protein
MSATFSELRDALPRRGSGAPARSRSHYEAILQFLRARGSQGVLGSELYACPELYGRSPRNRISELRRDGHLIEGKAHGSSDWFYRLLRDNTGVKPLSSLPDPPAELIPESDYMRRRRAEQEYAAPLFAGVSSD